MGERCAPARLALRKESTGDMSEYGQIERNHEDHGKGSGENPVSYTHLTLPTTYTV